MTNNSRKMLCILAVIVLYIPIVSLQHVIDPMRNKDFELANTQGTITTVGRALPIEFTLAAATGFRQAIAGLLWVRTDDFFDQGNYDAIVPMVRIITWLDPQNIDVYQTGAWHLAYNFTDSEQRSDRRYIPLAISLLKEGIANNPTATKLYADLAFTHYFRKLCNFDEAVKWYEKGQAVMETDPKLPLSVDPQTGIKDHYVIDPITHEPRSDSDPTILGHGLAHALTAQGDIDGAIKQWKYCIAQHQRLIKEIPDKATEQQEQNSLNVAEENLNETIMRQKYRLTDTKPPYNVNLRAWVVRVSPMQLRFQGLATFIGATSFKLEGHKVKWGKIDGARIGFRLEDADYVQPQEIPFDLSVKLPKNVTILQESAAVAKGRFNRSANMQPDSLGDNPMYPLKAKRYKVTFWFDPTDPASAPPNLQDRIGYIGEGITDPRYLNLNGKVPGALQAPDERSRARLLIKVMYMSRDDIMGTGLKRFE